VGRGRRRRRSISSERGAKGDAACIPTCLCLLASHFCSASSCSITCSVHCVASEAKCGFLRHMGLTPEVTDTGHVHMHALSINAHHVEP
jgi:hypothetical protein